MPIALIFHELATNAAKYGALSASDWDVAVLTRVADDVLTISWTELGSLPIANPPPQTTFGLKLIKLSAENQLGSSILRSWQPVGLAIEMRIRPSRLADDHQTSGKN